MEEEIKFVEFLPKTGRLRKALFNVGEQTVIIGVEYTLISVWNIGQNTNSIKLFLQKFGPLQIQLMIAKNQLADYNFEQGYFLNADGSSIKYNELEDYLKNKILEAEEEFHSIGFKFIGKDK